MANIASQNSELSRFPQVSPADQADKCHRG
jgi:hypothetical protein